MTFRRIEPPRTFVVKGETRRHVADAAPEPGDIVTFLTGAGGQYDVARTEWGFYATPSLDRRLPGFGLRAALVRGDDGAGFIMLVEDGCVGAFDAYCARQGARVVCRLDASAALDRIEQAFSAAAPCPMCGGVLRFAARFDRRPDGETDFAFAPYRRELWSCEGCGHVVNRHDMDVSRLYDGAYAAATYGDRLHATFERVMALPPEKSDNRGRAARIAAYWAATRADMPRTLLDIGAGVGVFPAVMRAAGWSCLALDPDPCAARHLRDAVGVEGMEGELQTADFGDRRFSLTTLNKVLEHAPDPLDMLRRAAASLAPGGLLYVEVPDGEAALQDSPTREEFFIEHLCAFSPASLALLCRRAGLRVEQLERLREASGKYTLRAFLRNEA